jgi:hypothetical protein
MAYLPVYSFEHRPTGLEEDFHENERIAATGIR